MEVEASTARRSERHMRETTRAREAYVQQFYGADARDAALYHLVIDSTALALDACVELDRVGGGGAQRSGELMRGGAALALAVLAAAVAACGGGGVASSSSSRRRHRLRLRAPPDRPLPVLRLCAVPAHARHRPRGDRPPTSSAGWSAARRSPTCCGATTTPVPARSLRAADRRRVAATPTVPAPQAEDWRTSRGTARTGSLCSTSATWRTTARSRAAIDVYRRERPASNSESQPYRKFERVS